MFSPNYLQAPSQTYRWVIAIGLVELITSAANYTHKWPLPESFFAMPFDTLSLEVSNGVATDLLLNWTLYCKRWQD